MPYGDIWASMNKARVGEPVRETIKLNFFCRCSDKSRKKVLVAQPYVATTPKQSIGSLTGQVGVTRKVLIYPPKFCETKFGRVARSIKVLYNKNYAQ
ncbi:hypothetical protein COS59_00515 [Candidatus Wolfebacteria bacterium CG03_land_8_20_14_0_80_36_15]|uniref:Uncharacterized protein n=1 Tax=Candidatus Wolfebacteria bacterium CG03_land_8_20_14_0_80_36_15 TaxID=1975067 RepID=A0A2M7B881_9BACT|nr:MAG: hypothetical protein COS59_00515 [Candidatus Wolfebacteria bacterium CG03_land_8_20_14_0_80_36_15]